MYYYKHLFVETFVFFSGQNSKVILCWSALLLFLCVVSLFITSVDILVVCNVSKPYAEVVTVVPKNVIPFSIYFPIDAANRNVWLFTTP